MTTKASAALTLGTEGFGAANLPYGSIEHHGTTFLGVRLGDHAVSLKQLAEATGNLSNAAMRAVGHTNLDILLAAGRPTWTEVRDWITATVQDDHFTDAVQVAATPLAEVSMRLAFTPADYVDYYASEHHAEN